MRPTIPLGPWRLAIDLEATHLLQRSAFPRPRGCTCEACLVWERHRAELLPPTLKEQLRRLGLDPAEPSEAYLIDATGGLVGLRASYYCVGSILNGPPELRFDAERNGGRHYERVEDAPNDIALAVAYQDTLGRAPAWAPTDLRPLLVVDLWALLSHPGGRPIARRGTSTRPTTV